MKKIFLLTTLLISLNNFAQVPNYVATNGLVGYWPFTGNANDISGNGNNATVNGAQLTIGHNAGGADAYYFNNTTADCGTHYIQANINTSSINTNGAMSLSFWIFRVADGCLGARVMEFNSCATCPGQILVTWVNGSNTMTFRHYLTATNFLTYNFSNMATGNWYHVVYTNDGTTAKYYLNGVLVNTFVSPNPAQLNGNVAFGRMNHASYDAFNGNLDDIGLWSRALSACEVSALYTGNPSSTFGYNALPDTTLICDSIKLDANAGYSTYIWSTGESAQIITAKQNGWYKVTVTNSGGCTASDSTYISIVKPAPTASKSIICAGDNVTLNANGVSGTSQTLIKQFDLATDQAYTITVPTIIGANYIMTVSGIWSVHFCTDPNNVSDAAFYYQRSPVTALPDNLNLVTWNGTAVRPDGNTYNSSHIYNYTLPPATQTTQSFSFSDPGTYIDNCGALTFQIYQVKTNNVTYTWAANPFATAGLNVADINKQSLAVSPTATTTYYVTANDAVTTCMDSIKITVATSDTSLTVLDPLAICKNGGGSVRLHAGIANSYKWLLNGSPIPGAAAVDYTATQAGTYRVVVTNNTGCTDTSRAITVSLYPLPVVSFNINSTTQCLGSNNFTFTNTSNISSGAITGDQWFFGDGLSDNTINSTHTFTTANTYSVKLIATSDNGCKDSSSQPITVTATPSTPIVTTGGPILFCGSGSVLLSSNAVTGNQWYQDGNIITGAVNQTYTATTGGIYTAIATVNNCASLGSNSITVTVTPNTITPTITAGGPLSFCKNGTVILTSSAASNNQWYQDGNLISGANGQAYTATTAATYTVIDNTNNCPSALSQGVTLSISPSPQVQFAPIAPVCENGSSFALNEGSDISGLAGNGSYSGDGVITDTISIPKSYLFSPQLAGAGAHIIHYRYIADNGCIGDTEQTIIVNSVPVVDFGGTKTISQGDSAQLFPISASSNGLKYSWSPALYLNSDTVMAPVCKPFNDIAYTITVRADSLCASTDMLLVKMLSNFDMPNTFTPNGDGINDTWIIEKLAAYPVHRVQVFNRYGQLLFESSNYKPWDGTYKGKPLPSGTYYYIIELGDAGDTKTGYVTILR